MRIFIAGLSVETITFSTFPTSLHSFEINGLHQGDGTLVSKHASLSAPQEWRHLAEGDGHEVVESVMAFAQSAGTVVRPAYEDLRDRILEDLENAGPVDVVLYSMHGAMAADGYDDCEGDLAKRTRDLVGKDVVIGMELDLHAHLTREMMDNITAIVTYKEYPHTDQVPRAREVYKICVDAAAGRIRPVSAAYDLRMIGLWRTSQQPMRDFVDHLQSLEGKDGILSLSLVHANPWLDVKNVGARMLVIADGDQELAEKMARSLGEQFWEMRDATGTKYLDIDQALDAALIVKDGPAILADVADNPGGGAPCDSTFILERALERGITGLAIGCLWDPIAVEIAMDAGVGATIPLRMGGKCGPTSGRPVDMLVTVRAIMKDHWQTGLSGPKTTAPLGNAVWVNGNGIDLILVSRRSQTVNTNAIERLGLDLSKCQMVVVKSTQHFYASFSKISDQILYVTTTGTIQPDFEHIPYQNNTTPFWPKFKNPARTML